MGASGPVQPPRRSRCRGQRPGRRCPATGRGWSPGRAHPSRAATAAFRGQVHRAQVPPVASRDQPARRAADRERGTAVGVRKPPALLAVGRVQRVDAHALDAHVHRVAPHGGCLQDRAARTASPQVAPAPAECGEHRAGADVHHPVRDARRTGGPELLPAAAGVTPQQFSRAGIVGGQLALAPVVEDPATGQSDRVGPVVALRVCTGPARSRRPPPPDPLCPG